MNKPLLDLSARCARIQALEPAMKSSLIDIACLLKHETDKAWLVNNGAKDVWLPKSACELELGRNMTCVVTLPERLAKEKELI